MKIHHGLADGVSGVLCVVILAAVQASAQGPVIRHADYQLDAGDPANSPFVTPLPFRLRGVVLNNTEDWLDPAAHFDNQKLLPPFLGGQAEFIVQAVNLDGTAHDPYPGEDQAGAQDPLADDFGGTFVFIAQNYGNLPFVPDPDLAYIDQDMAGVPGETRPVWYDELDRLSAWRPGRALDDPGVIRAGDLVEVRAVVNGLIFGGKHNVNERHTIDPANDFEVAILEKAYGLPQPSPLTLDLLKDANNQAIYDPTRQAAGEQYQGARVQIQGVTFDSLPPGTLLQSNMTYTVADGTGRTFPVRLGLNTGMNSAFVPGGLLNLTGVLDQSSSTGKDGYRLLVLNPREIEPALWGDFNGNRVYDVKDIDLLTRETASGQHGRQYDLNGDALVDGADVRVWAKDLADTWIGDANVNGLFDSNDFVAVFAVGKYELPEDAVWSQGDWSGDGRFNSNDFIQAFEDGGYEQGARPAAAVPEPSSLTLLVAGCVGVLAVNRRLRRW